MDVIMLIVGIWLAMLAVGLVLWVGAVEIGHRISGNPHRTHHTSRIDFTDTSRKDRPW